MQRWTSERERAVVYFILGAIAAAAVLSSIGCQ
jgi:hypothetical protein